MNYPVFFCIIISFFLYTVWVSKTTVSKNNNEYFLSGRNLNVFSLTLTMLATQLGGAAIIGNGETAYTHGWQALFYSLGLSLGMLALACGVGARFRKLNVQTIPELFHKYYHSKSLRLIAATLSIISLFLILIGIGIAAKKIFINLGITSEYIFLSFWSIAIIYTVIGGLSAVVKTDIFQVSFIALSLSIVLIAIFHYHDTPSIGFIQASSTNYIPWSEWILMPFLFVIIGQDMGQRCFAAKSPKTVSTSAFFAAISLFLLSAIPTFIGNIAAHSNFQLTDGSIILSYIENITNPYITAIFAPAILMAILSTADSLICSISLNISQDLLPNISKKLAEKINISRSITFFVGMSAMLLSCIFNDIIAMILIAYKISIYTLFVPIFMVTIYNKPNKIAAYVSVFIGAVFFLINQIYNISHFDYISLIACAFSFIIINKYKTI